MKELLTDLIFPRRCPVCDGVVAFKKGLIHPECAGGFKIIGDIRCMKCGRPLKHPEEELCVYCRRRSHAFDRGIALYHYDDAMSSSIFRYKYGNRQEYAEYFSREMVRLLSREIRRLSPQGLTCIPLSRKRYRKRGYNQAALLSSGIGVLTGIPVYNDLLIRVRDTLPQKTLDSAGRIKNLKKAFKIARNDVKLNSIMVIDDIYTTGSTVDEAAAVLKAAGISRVFVMTLSAVLPRDDL